MRDDQDIDKTAGGLRERFRTAGQEHVFTFWDHLKDGERRGFIQQLEGIDLELVSSLAESAGAEPARGLPRGGGGEHGRGAGH